jgi:hypothetical protein
VLGIGEEKKERVESGEKENVLGIGDQKEREESGEKENVLGVGEEQKERVESALSLLFLSDIFQHLIHSPFPHFLLFLSDVQHLAHSPFPHFLEIRKKEKKVGKRRMC